MLFSGKILSHVAARLTARYWVPYLLRCATNLPLFGTIRHYLPLFASIRDCAPLFALFKTIRTIRSSGLFAVRYSRLFAISYSGFPDTLGKIRETKGALHWMHSTKISGNFGLTLNGSVPSNRKFRKSRSTFRGGPLFSVGPVRWKLTVPFDRPFQTILNLSTLLFGTFQVP